MKYSVGICKITSWHMRNIQLADLKYSVEIYKCQVAVIPEQPEYLKYSVGIYLKCSVGICELFS